jgi:photosystem II stability/assembly factor-like uncharacterized protein
MNKTAIRSIISIILIELLCGCGGTISEASPTQETGTMSSSIEDIIIFNADLLRLSTGECTRLYWKIIDGFGARIDGEEVPMSGERKICPAETTQYHLTVDMGTHSEVREVEIIIAGESDNPTASSASGVALPAYTAEKWIATGGPPGGLGYDIRMRPDNPDIMFVTDAHAGIHKSTDGGLTWVPSNSGITRAANNDVPIFCVTIDPHNYDVVWAGTQLIGRVYRSGDNGDSWVEKDNGITQQGRSLRGITIDPNHANIIYAASEVDAVTWAIEMQLPDVGGYGGEVYKSIDSGENWNRIWAGDNIARYVWVDPRNSNRVYVTTGIFDRTPANATPQDRGGVGILRSDDGGESWTVLNQANGLSGLIIPSLFMHPENPDILIASVSNYGIGGVFITYNGGDSWNRAEEGPVSSDAVEISTSNPDIWYSATEGQISRSDDAGQTWQTYTLATSDRTAGMPIDLQVDPRDPYRIFDNNYGGGNFLSQDGGQTWVDASSGYTGATIAGMLVLPGNDQSLIAGANTSGFLSNDGGKTWSGTGLPAVTNLTALPNDIIVSDSGGNIWHSQDQGMNWERTIVVNLQDEMNAGRMNNDIASMRAFAVAPSDPNSMYVGFHDAICIDGIAPSCLEPMPNMYRSQDGGYTWQEITGAAFERKSVLSLAIHPDNSQDIYAATVLGLFHSNNGGDTWTMVDSFDLATRQVQITGSDNSMAILDLWVVTDVVFDPFDSQTIYAATQHGGVWRSNDGGKSWTQSSGGMDPNEIVARLLPDPNNSKVVYAATILSGVYVTLNGGEYWQQINNGLTPHRIVNLALSQDSSTLYAGSGARGVWRLSTQILP